MSFDFFQRFFLSFFFVFGKKKKKKKKNSAVAHFLYLSRSLSLSPFRSKHTASEAGEAGSSKKASKHSN